MKLWTLLEEYLDQKSANDALISVTNFRVWLRQKGFKRITYQTHKDWADVKDELNMLYEDWLITRAAKGERHSQNYLQLLKSHQEKMARTSQDLEPVRISIDFENEGSNKI